MMTFETTKFERVPDMRGYYISSNGPASGEFAPIEQLNKLKRQNKNLMELYALVKIYGFPDGTKAGDDISVILETLA